MNAYLIVPDNVPKSERDLWEQSLQQISENIPNWIEHAESQKLVIVLAPLMRQRYEVHVVIREVFPTQWAHEITEYAQLKSVVLKNLILN